MSFQELIKESPGNATLSESKNTTDEKCECASCSEKFFKDQMTQNGDYGFYYCHSCYWWARKGENN